MEIIASTFTIQSTFFIPMVNYYAMLQVFLFTYTSSIYWL